MSKLLPHFRMGHASPLRSPGDRKLKRLLHPDRLRQPLSLLSARKKGIRDLSSNTFFPSRFDSSGFLAAH